MSRHRLGSGFGAGAVASIEQLFIKLMPIPDNITLSVLCQRGYESRPFEVPSAVAGEKLFIALPNE